MLSGEFTGYSPLYSNSRLLRGWWGVQWGRRGRWGPYWLQSLVALNNSVKYFPFVYGNGTRFCVPSVWWNKWLNIGSLHCVNSATEELLIDQNLYWACSLSVLIVARDLSWPFSPSVFYCRLRHRSPKRTHAVWSGKNFHYLFGSGGQKTKKNKLDIIITLSNKLL